MDRIKEADLEAALRVARRATGLHLVIADTGGKYDRIAVIRDGKQTMIGVLGDKRDLYCQLNAIADVGALLDELTGVDHTAVTDRQFDRSTGNSSLYS